MVLDYKKYEMSSEWFYRDARDTFKKAGDDLREPRIIVTVFVSAAAAIFMHPFFSLISDILLLFLTIYFLWLLKKPHSMPLKMPQTSGRIDPNNVQPGTGVAKKAEGILYFGNEDRERDELWLNNTDARTHILYLGTTGAGKTEGLKSLVSNAMGWGSGFIYIDGKADTDLWGSLSSLARRFGRDDDLLLLNYMTGNSDGQAASNTLNPFSYGSASYLTNLMTSLMPDAGGDNQMWKDRAVSLMAALMPVLTYLRDHHGKMLSITTVRDSLIFKKVVQYSRDPMIPEKLRRGLVGYLDTLPGFNDEAFNDDGTERAGPGGQPQDMSVVYQQHGYLSMQFTRQLQSLADDYGYIFEKDSADIDMMDVVLNRRILVVLIPALEKSADETANLGKILSAMLKGMMGGTLGSEVEGDTDLAIGNKPTRAPTPFISVFDEVGYYTAQGMAVMAAQARSLGFCLIFAGQDLPAMEKRVKEEARSITANCNLKIFGKLEDPTDTKDFFEKTVGEATVAEATSQKEVSDIFGDNYHDSDDVVSLKSTAKAYYSELKAFSEGEAVVNFGDLVIKANIFFANPTGIKALRVNKFIAMQEPDPDRKFASRDVDAVIERFREKGWTAEGHASPVKTDDRITALVKGFAIARKSKKSLVKSGAAALIRAGLVNGTINTGDFKKAMQGLPVSDSEPPKPEDNPDTKSKEEAKPSAPNTKAEETKSPTAESKESAPEPAEKTVSEQSESNSDDTPSDIPVGFPGQEEAPKSWEDLMVDDEASAKEKTSEETPISNSPDSGAYTIQPSFIPDENEPEAAPTDEPPQEESDSLPSDDNVISWADLAGKSNKAETDDETEDDETPLTGFPGQETPPKSWTDLMADDDDDES